MKLKATLAAASLALATATAGAQSTPARPFPPGALANLARQMLPQAGNGPIQEASSMRAGTVNNLGNVPIGFDVVHATNCVWLTPDAINNFLFILSQEGEVFVFLNPPGPAEATAASACSNGNFIGVNVFDSAGDFNELATFPFK